MLLVRVAAVLTTSIFVVNLVLRRPILDAMLFSLAIAVGITPQLLPALVTTGLAAGARRLTRLKVLVKRLVVIEDLGDIEVLFTDKTGTLTRAAITLRETVPVDPEDDTLRYALLCTGAGGAETTDPLDGAFRRRSPGHRGRHQSPLPYLPFAADLGFSPVTAGILLVVGGIVTVYLTLAELIKPWFYRSQRPARLIRPRDPRHRVHRRAALFSIAKRSGPASITGADHVRAVRRQDAFGSAAEGRTRRPLMR